MNNLEAKRKNLETKIVFDIFYRLFENKTILSIVNGGGIIRAAVRQINKFVNYLI